ncbi:hypothetical protein AB0C69_35640 [Actinomadura sp. NPDC048032]|uniref:scabin-related ADP-ribosyltransferase n=1 Tax=Actinomadura sp. NPDC048032 TaxID=3155747 RepID=UPI0033F6C89A
MGVEHPTRTDTKVETDDQPGPPGQKSNPDGRAATQQPTDQKGETPPPARSARAENSNDPNDDPNRTGTPRADSLAIARGEKPEPPNENRETPPPARSIRAENSNDPNDDPNRTGTPRADSLAIARGEKPEPPAETTPSTPEPHAERPPGTSGTPRADSMAIARGEKLETDENEADAAEPDPPVTPKERPAEAEPPADDNREPDNTDPAAPGEQPLGEQDMPSHPKPRDDQPPAPETSGTDEPADVTPEPDDGDGQTPPQDAQPLDHGILDNRAEDVERPAETNPEDADGKPPAETGEQLGDAQPAPKTEPAPETPPEPSDGEPPLHPEPGVFEEPESPLGDHNHLGPEPKELKDGTAQEPADEGPDGPDDGEQDRGEDDPMGAGAPDSQSKDGDKGRDGDQERARSHDDPLEKYRRAVKNPQRVFRGDTRSPDEIFLNGDGFRARGTSNDLKRYAELNEPSRFIGTSMTEDAAKPFTVAVQGNKRKLHGWVYEIESPEPAINVNKALGLRYRLVLWGQSEKEMAYLDHIPREHIKRAREVKGLSYTGKVVENPYFQGR